MANLPLDAYWIITNTTDGKTVVETDSTESTPVITITN